MESNHSNAVRKVNDRRDELAQLANSDSPAAWVAEALLDATDEYEAE